MVLLRWFFSLAALAGRATCIVGLPIGIQRQIVTETGSLAGNVSSSA
jgi:hypothetical protein